MFKLIALGLALLCVQSLWAQEFSYDQMNILRNDKEPLISVFSKYERKKIEAKNKNTSLSKKLENILYHTILNNLNTQPVNCDLNVAKNFKNGLSENGLPSDKDSIKEYLKILRVNNSIDDILYRIMDFATDDYFNIMALDLNKKAKKTKPKDQILKANDLSELFAGFMNEVPNDLDRCTYQEYYFIKSNISDGDGKKSTKDKDLKALISEAYQEKLITLQTYNVLTYLRDDADFKNRDMWLDDYLRVTWRAKNKLVPIKQDYVVKNIEDESGFSSEHIKRFSKVTRRRLLYRKYDETQIILMAQVMQKASRRMGVDPDTKSGVPFITQEFWIVQEDGTQKNLVEKIELDPQSQYNLARRRMRKDIVDLQMMDIFTNQIITYEDVVMASLETGYITLDDLALVVKYDDLWNPNISKFQRISSFIFNVAGYGTFFLPPPWNITATIALGVVEGIVDSKTASGADNDNANTFIE